MERYISEIDLIINKLEGAIQEKELGLNDVLTDAPIIIKLLESGFEELKLLISDFHFEEKSDEILFFKIKKPRLFSKLIYYQKIYHIELNRPVSGFQVQECFLKKEFEQINAFYNKNTEFIQYYRSGKTLMDEFYFIRGKNDIELNLESFYFERDPRFSTAFDFKVTRLLANDMLAAYLNNQLARLKYQEENSYNIDDTIPYAKWTDKKTALAEIIYGIHEAKSINAGNIGIKMLATILGNTFKIDMSDIYQIFLEIRSRKGDRTTYLSSLIKSLNQKMEAADNR